MYNCRYEKQNEGGRERPGCHTEGVERAAGIKEGTEVTVGLKDGAVTITRASPPTESYVEYFTNTFSKKLHREKSEHQEAVGGGEG